MPQTVPVCCLISSDGVSLPTYIVYTHLAVGAHHVLTSLPPPARLRRVAGAAERRRGALALRQSGSDFEGGGRGVPDELGKLDQDDLEGLPGEGGPSCAVACCNALCLAASRRAVACCARLPPSREQRPCYVQMQHGNADHGVTLPRTRPPDRPTDRPTSRSHVHIPWPQRARFGPDDFTLCHGVRTLSLTLPTCPPAHMPDCLPDCLTA